MRIPVSFMPSAGSSMTLFSAPLGSVGGCRSVTTRPNIEDHNSPTTDAPSASYPVSRLMYINTSDAQARI